MILPCPDRPLRLVGSVVEGRGYLEVNGGLRGTEESFKVSRSLVINFKITKGMRE
jgi:hypothetical protein